MNNIFLRLYNAALRLHITGPTHLLLRERSEPADLYEFFKIPKHLSIILLLDLKLLKQINKAISIQAALFILITFAK